MENKKGRKNTGMTIKLYIHFFTDGLPKNEKVAHPRGKIGIRSDDNRNIKTKHHAMFNKLNEIQNKVEEVLTEAGINFQ
tara:strand:+ start:68 stop:304 length:237 start_codon:yes stop_codon:yes gene_type:complete